MISAMHLAESYLSSARAALNGQQMATIGKAMQAYIKDNYNTVIGLATNTTPALITVDMLRLAGYLPTGAKITNGYNQTICGLVLQPNPASEKLNALIVTEKILPTAETINDVDVAQIAGVIGAAGGGVYSTSSANITGAMGGWSIPVTTFDNLTNDQGKRCDGTTTTPTGAVRITTGTIAMALWFAEDKAANVLYRDKVGSQVELNQMNTPLKMSSLQTAWSGTNCTAAEEGSFTIGPAVSNYTGKTDDKGNGSPMSAQLLICQKMGKISGTADVFRWGYVGMPAFWYYSHLPTNVCGTDVPFGQIAAVLRTSTPNEYGGKAYMCGLNSAGTAGEWKPLGTDDNGNITIAGTATIAKLAGSLELDSSINQTVDNASTCPTPGRIARDSAGRVLACVDGASGDYWKHMGGFWQASVTNHATLLTLTCNPSRHWEVRVVNTPTVGTPPRAYVCDADNNTWTALAVDNSGNLTIPGTATINELDGNLRITSTAAPGDPCSPDGRLARSTTVSGQLLSCQSSVWRVASKRDSVMVISTYNTGVMDCPTGWRAYSPYSYGGYGSGSASDSLIWLGGNYVRLRYCVNATGKQVYMTTSHDPALIACQFGTDLGIQGSELYGSTVVYHRYCEY